MDQTEKTQEPGSNGVLHHKTETVTTDYEKIINAAGPLINVWQTSETERKRLHEEGSTKRTGSANLTLLLIVAIFCILAAISVYSGNAGIAEKIVIGLLGFLGGMYMRRE